tara:strand:- start:6909 stop:7793 length:885 start_codon:yes stop_codon:yes gene_type:complete
MDIHYSILGVDKSTSIEDVKKAFRVSSLNDDSNFDILEEAYKHIIQQKDVDMINSNITAGMIFPAKQMLNHNLLNKNNNDNMMNPLENMFSMILGDNSNTDNSTGVENILNEIADKMFNLKSNISKIREENSKDETKIICKEHNITIQDIYNNTSIGDLLHVDELKFHYIENYNFNDVNDFTIRDGDQKSIYKIKFNIVEDSNFKIIDNTLCYILKISLKEALCGFSHNLHHLNGKSYMIKNYNKIINTTSKITLDNMGIKKNDGNGHLTIIFDIIFPQELTDDNKTILSEIFG